MAPHGTAPDLPRHRERNPIVSSLCIGALAFSVPMLYLASYAPVVRWEASFVHTDPIDSKDFPLYRPADWVIDRTPLCGAMIWWSDRCGVAAEFQWAYHSREHDRREVQRHSRNAERSKRPPPTIRPRELRP